MATEARTAQFSVRLHERDKTLFTQGTERCGMDPSVAVRQIVELAVQRLEKGGDFIDALHELKRAWGVPVEAPANDAPMPTARYHKL